MTTVWPEIDLTCLLQPPARVVESHVSTSLQYLKKGLQEQDSGTFQKHQCGDLTFLKTGDPNHSSGYVVHNSRHSRVNDVYTLHLQARIWYPVDRSKMSTMSD